MWVSLSQWLLLDLFKLSIEFIKIFYDLKWWLVTDQIDSFKYFFDFGRFFDILFGSERLEFFFDLPSHGLPQLIWLMAKSFWIIDVDFDSFRFSQTYSPALFFYCLFYSLLLTLLLHSRTFILLFHSLLFYFFLKRVTLRVSQLKTILKYFGKLDAAFKRLIILFYLLSHFFGSSVISCLIFLNSLRLITFLGRVHR